MMGGKDYDDVLLRMTRHRKEHAVCVAATVALPALCEARRLSRMHSSSERALSVLVELVEALQEARDE